MNLVYHRPLSPWRTYSGWDSVHYMDVIYPSDQLTSRLPSPSKGPGPAISIRAHAYLGTTDLFSLVITSPFCLLPTKQCQPSTTEHSVDLILELQRSASKLILDLEFTAASCTSCTFREARHVGDDKVSVKFSSSSSNFSSNELDRLKAKQFNFNCITE